MLRTRLSSACSCLRSSARTLATEATPSAHRLVASSLLSRSPLTLPALTPFENSYYAYQRSLHRALNKPLDDTLEWFYKKGSTGEKGALEAEKKVDDVLVEEEVEGDRKSLERKRSRTVYLLLKKDRKDHAWQFPQGGLEGTESLVEAASRELTEEAGENLDVWPIGRVPAAVHEYAFPKGAERDGKKGAKVFFMPFRVVRGTPELNKAEGLVDYAWLTKEEIKDVVSEGLWEAVAPALSDR